ncbi:regulatory protein GemA [Sphingomonas sp. AOB5]|uniref:regulatory protein GemA n=1 Tax=Sphingomonas sp. AOB5 TaxID=3034017 RepID=UPI0023F6BC2B|nr:regulatory protein GemA [Sphingomonas sp. AOB5]MDF7776896.1 regulatory protein GemA [Sphingomonas sp. AOB5]
MKAGARLFGAGRAHNPLTFGREDAEFPLTPYRRSLIAKIHVAKKEIGLIDSDYRQILINVAKVSSSNLASNDKLVAVIEHFKSRGWKEAAPKGKRGKGTPASFPGALKARAMWISLHQLGVIDDSSDAALDAFACRQLGCTRFQWAKQAEIYKLVEALKAMAGRAGWDQSTKGLDPAAVPIVLRRRLVDRQLEILIAAEWADADWDVARAARSFGGVEIMGVITATSSELDQVAQALGKAIREAKAAGAVK